MALARKSAFVAALTAFLSACGGGGGGGGGGGPSTPAPPQPPVVVQTPPTFTSSASVSVPENYIDVVYRPAATDAQNDAISYGAITGPDAALFTMNTVTREVRFARAPDREQPADADRDSIYQISFTASDVSGTTTLPVQITVTDVQPGYRIRKLTDHYGRALRGYPDGSERVVIVGDGTISLFDPARPDPISTLLDLRIAPYLDSVRSSAITGDIAFSPNFLTDKTFYIWSELIGSHVQVIKFKLSDRFVDQADVASADVIFRANVASKNNSALGFLTFDHKGRLLIGVNSLAPLSTPPSDSPAQDTTNIFGKILRIDPSTDAFPNDRDNDYAIPSDNPFASGGGLPEIYAMGVYLPQNAHLAVGGQSVTFSDRGEFMSGPDYIIRQEINALPVESSQLTNFGWPLMAGGEPEVPGSSHPGLTTAPIAYDDATGPAILGGVAYQGPIENFQGFYFFGDHFDRKVWSIPLANIRPGLVNHPAAFLDYSGSWTQGMSTADRLRAFGTDTRGNLYISATNGTFIVEPLP